MARLRRSCASAPVVDLGPIGDDGLVEIIGDMLGTREVDPGLSRELVRLAQGNPFFAAEYLRAAMAEGLLRRSRSGRWELGEPGADASERTGSRSGSVHELIARRLDALPSDAARLLDIAAVFGREVDADLLEAVGLLDEPRLMTSLEALLSAQLLEEPEAGQFVFLHDKLREVAYARIPVEGRRELHMRAAVAIEARRDLASPDPAADAILAHHWSRSVGDPATQPDRTERALHYLKLALDQAVRSGLAREAIEFGQVAARLLGVALPETPEAVEGALHDEMEEFQRRMAGRLPAQLLELPDSHDSRSDQTIGLLLAMLPPAHVSNGYTLFVLAGHRGTSIIPASGSRFSLRRARWMS